MSKVPIVYKSTHRVKFSELDPELREALTVGRAIAEQ